MTALERRTLDLDDALQRLEESDRDMWRVAIFGARIDVAADLIETPWRELDGRTARELAVSARLLGIGGRA